MLVLSRLKGRSRTENCVNPKEMGVLEGPHSLRSAAEHRSIELTQGKTFRLAQQTSLVFAVSNYNKNWGQCQSAGRWDSMTVAPPTAWLRNQSGSFEMEFGVRKGEYSQPHSFWRWLLSLSFHVGLKSGLHGKFKKSSRIVYMRFSLVLWLERTILGNYNVHLNLHSNENQNSK